jgi:ABC-type transport system substrate-binding protein
MRLCPTGAAISRAPAAEGFGSIKTSAPPGSASLWWNARHPLFQDTKVRRALTLAINRRELNLLSFPEDMPIADLPLTKRQLERGDLPEPIPYDPALANRLLDEVGWSARNRDGLRLRGGKPFRFRLLAGGGGVGIAVYVQERFKRVGVRMDIRLLPQIPSRRQQVRYGLHVSARAWNDPSPDWRGVSCRLIAVRNWRSCPPGQQARRGLLRQSTQLARGRHCTPGSLRGAPLVPVMKSADWRYRHHGSAFR